VVLVYSRQPFGHPQALLSRRRHVGEGWTKPTTLAREGYGPQLAVDRAGDAVVAFTPNFGRVMAVYRRSGGRWAAPRRLSPVGVHTDDFALSMNATGVALVVYGRERGRVDMVRRPPRGRWSAPAHVVKTASEQCEAVVALNRTGDTFLGWGCYALYGKYRPHGETWGTRTTLSPDRGGDVLNILLAEVAPNGDVVVIWEQDGPLLVRVRTAS
jgi:hypothetical protein